MEVRMKRVDIAKRMFYLAYTATPCSIEGDHTRTEEEVWAAVQCDWQPNRYYGDYVFDRNLKLLVIIDKGKIKLTKKPTHNQQPWKEVYTDCYGLHRAAIKSLYGVDAEDLYFYTDHGY